MHIQFDFSESSFTGTKTSLQIIIILIMLILKRVKPLRSDIKIFIVVTLKVNI